MNRDGIVQCATSREGFVAVRSCIARVWRGASVSLRESWKWFLSHVLLSISVHLIGVSGRTQPHGASALQHYVVCNRGFQLLVRLWVTQHGAGNSVKRWEWDWRGSSNMISAPSKSKPFCRPLKNSWHFSKRSYKLSPGTSQISKCIFYFFG